MPQQFLASYLELDRHSLDHLRMLLNLLGLTYQPLILVVYLKHQLRIFYIHRLTLNLHLVS